MLPKETLLATIQADRQALLAAIEGVPNEALALPGAAGQYSALEVLAYITAWDGETMRRIDFAAGQGSAPAHDVHDEAYWEKWAEEQVKIKQVMGPRGIKVDMASTWIRLLARLEALAPPDYARWLEIDPRGQQRNDLELAQQLQTWRERWERSLPWWRRGWRALKQLWISSGQLANHQ